MSGSQSKRGIVFIKKRFQLRFIVSVLATLVLFGLVSAALVYGLLGSDLGAGSRSAHATIDSLAARMGTIVLLGNLAAALVAGATAAIVVMYTSHRIAGPLYRFETLCTQVGEGNLDARTELRDADQLKDLSVAFGAMLERLRTARAQRLEIADALEAQLTAPGGTGGEERTAAVRALLARLRATESRTRA